MKRGKDRIQMLDLVFQSDFWKEVILAFLGGKRNVQ
jgi:hypothetical protein